MKIFKRIFSRSVLTFIVIAVQFGLFYGFFKVIYFGLEQSLGAVLAEHFWIINLIEDAFLLVITVVMCSIVVNRPIIADAKVPWLIIIAFGPIFGFALYAMFASNKVSKKKARTYFNIAYASKPFTYQFKDYSSRLGSYAGMANYFLKAAESPAHARTQTTYYSSGESFWLALLTDLREAKKSIFMEYFIIEEGMMWNSILSILREKVAEGVEVRIMYDDIGCMGRIPDNYDLTLTDLGIKCVRFNKFVPIASEVHNNRDHRKITIIDGKVGFIGGINIADEYVNVTKRFGHWKDSAVRIKGSAVRNLTVMFLRMFDAQTETQDDFGAYMPTDAPDVADDGIVVPFGDGPRPLYEEQVAENALLNIINFAGKYVYITTPYLVLDTSLQQALIRASLRGVDVRIVTPRIPDKKLVFNITRRNYARLQEYGIRIYEYLPGFIHAKNIVADDVNAIVGTINFDYRSLVHHYECGVWMYKSSCIADIVADFSAIFAESEEIVQGSIRVGFWNKLVTSLIMMFAPLL